MKNGIVIGALIGIAAGMIGVVLTMHLMSNQVIDKQAEAYDRGFEAGQKSVAADGVDISDHLNKGLMGDNEALASKLRTVKTGLQALQGRDDLTPQAKDQIAGIVASLE